MNTETQTKPKVKRRVTTDEYYPADAPGLCVEYQFRPHYAGCGPGWNHLGCPPEPASVEIIGINTDDGKDVLPWLESHGFDFEKLAEKILATH